MDSFPICASASASPLLEARGDGMTVMVGPLRTNSSILGMRSGIRKGFETTSSIPAERAVSICSSLAFAVTAYIV